VMPGGMILTYETNLPEDLEILEIRRSVFYGEWELFARSADFPAVQVGCEIPVIDVILQQTVTDYCTALKEALRREAYRPPLEEGESGGVRIAL